MIVVDNNELLLSFVMIYGWLEISKNNSRFSFTLSVRFEGTIKSIVFHIVLLARLALVMIRRLG